MHDTGTQQRIGEPQTEELAELFCLGQSHLRRGLAGEAEASFRRVLEADGGQAAVWMQLGAALRLQDRYPEALEVLERAANVAAEKGQSVDAFVEIATVYQRMGQTANAITVLEAALAEQPAVEGYRAYAELLLTSGRLREAWQHYEFRWLIEPLLSTRPGARLPEWNGQELRGKTVLLRIEQGFGDVIMSLRYAPWVQALGATTVVGKFSDLAHGFAGIDHVLENGVSSMHCDYFVPLMSLPRIFGTELGSIPAPIPYLRAEPERVRRWENRLTHPGQMQIGLVWAGRQAHPWDRYRSLALRNLAPLLGVQGARFVSLQKEADEELQTFAPERGVLNLGPELVDFADTAAVIAKLDLVICVDTAVAHLAGAMGKPVWVMLAQPADWRWLEEREDTPWYPTMRLFRQKVQGDWSEVIERVKAALERSVRAGNVESVSPMRTTTRSEPLLPKPTLARLAPGHKPGFSAVAETRAGIVQYFPDEPLVGDSISWYGEYLQGQLDVLAGLIRPGATLMEVGAGVGMHALYLAAAIGPTGHLFVYEPRPLLQRVLRQNLAANRIGNVTLMSRALGRASSIAGTETLDELQLEQLQLLKIGVGAAALDVLDGAAQTLWRLRPLLFIALREEAALGELSAAVKDFGYRCWKLETPLFSPQNFNRREEDIFAGGKASALLAIPEEIEKNAAIVGCEELA